MRRSGDLGGALRRDDRPKVDDAELMKRLANGDLAALGVLYDRYHDDVRRFLLKVTGDHADADDLTHEAFITLSKAAAAYDGRPSARPFLLGVAGQLAKRRHVSLARIARSLRALASAFTPERASPNTPEESAMVSEDIKRFDAALGELSAEKRLVLLLIEGEGLSGEEVARALNIPVATVWTRLHYARTALRAAMTKGRRS